MNHRRLTRSATLGFSLADRHSPTTPVALRHRRHTIVAALIAIGALGPTPGSLARPVHDIGHSTPQRAGSVASDHHPRATPGITFTNPLGRSRGPGAGAGLL